MQRPAFRAFSAPNLPKTTALLLFAAALIVFFGDVLLDAAGILFVACLIAFLLSPIVNLLEKKLNRSLSALLSLLLLAAALVLVLGFGIPALLKEAASLLDQLPAAFERLYSLAARLMRRFSSALPGFQLPDSALTGAENGLQGVARGTLETLSGIAGRLYRAGLSLVLAYFLLADKEKLLLRAELMLPSAWRKTCVQLSKTILRELRLYLRGQATIALAVGALASLALTLIGVRSAFLLGMLVGLCNMIPYFGPIIGSIPAVLLALSEGWQKAAFTAGAMFLVQQIDGMVISPRIMGNITGFSPAVVLLGLFIGSGVGGVWGLLLAMPLLMCFRTLYRVFVQRYENN